MLPKNRASLASAFTKGLFSPEYAVRDQNLNDLVQEVVIPERAVAARKAVIDRVQTEPGVTKQVPGVNGVPIPLTPEESDEADVQIAHTLERIAATTRKLALVRERINEAINSELDGKELSFKVDISKKRRVERAIKSLFGERLDTITYSMYVEMLQAKAQMEKDEVADYAAGKTKDDSEDEDRKNKE